MKKKKNEKEKNIEGVQGGDGQSKLPNLYTCTLMSGNSGCLTKRVEQQWQWGCKHPFNS